MIITERKIKVRDLIEGYRDNGHDGVRGYGGRLDIRPPYQREFVYGEVKQKAVVDSIQNRMPLSIMYWAVKPTEDGAETMYEVLDGQQRTLSICRYVEGAYADDQMRYFYNLPQDEKEAFLGYEVHVYICEGSDSEKLAWFRRINIAGEPLRTQELRNAVYAGPWLADAKRFFSKPGAGADVTDGDLVRGDAKRQDILEKALEWICHLQATTTEEYMARHQMDPNAAELKQYYKAVFAWVEEYFIKTRKEMTGLPWGEFYNDHGQRTDLDGRQLEERIKELMTDDEVTSKKGIYAYVLTGNPKHLSLRTFTQAQKRTLYERQGGHCAHPSSSGHAADQVFTLAEMEADHIDPWHAGGKTDLANGQLLCKPCNRRKSGT